MSPASDGLLQNFMCRTITLPGPRPLRIRPHQLIASLGCKSVGAQLESLRDYAISPSHTLQILCKSLQVLALAYQQVPVPDLPYIIQGTPVCSAPVHQLFKDLTAFCIQGGMTAL